MGCRTNGASELYINLTYTKYTKPILKPGSGYLALHGCDGVPAAIPPEPGDHQHPAPRSPCPEVPLPPGRCRPRQRRWWLDAVVRRQPRQRRRQEAGVRRQPRQRRRQEAGARQPEEDTFFFSILIFFVKKKENYLYLCFFVFS